MSSLISKKPRGWRNVANANGAVLTNNGQIRIDLNKDFLVSRHKVHVDIAQAFTGVPTSSDVRRAFSKLELVSNEGTIFTSDFAQFYDMQRFASLASSPKITLAAAAKASFAFNLPYANAKAHADLATALQSANFSTLALVLTVSPDASNCFIGGTVPLAAAYTVAVDSQEHAQAGFTGGNANDRNAIKFGHARHYFKAMDEKSSASAAASNQELKLETGGRTRWVILQTYDTTGAIPVLANGILDKVNLSFGGHDYFVNVAGKTIQQENVDERNFDQTGVYVLDMGDDQAAWLPMVNINEVKLRYSTLGTAPAGWKVTCAQDFTVGLDNLGVR